MRKKHLLPFAIIAIMGTSAVHAQLKVGLPTGAPNAGAIIDASNTGAAAAAKRGIYLPQVQLSSNIVYGLNTAGSAVAVDGMMVYNIAAAGTAPNNVTAGTYIWQGGVWNKVGTSSTPTSDKNIYEGDGTLTGTRVVTQGSNSLTFAGTGNVGFGATPVTKFHVMGNGLAFPATSGTAQSAGHMARLQAGNNALLDLGGFSTLGFWLQSTDASNLASNYPLLLNPNGGNVGVGTTTPSARLHATGIGNAYPATTGATQSLGNIARFQTSDDLVLDLGGNSVNGSWIQSSLRTDLNVKYSLLLNPNGGNVGVGTTTPTANLHVAGNARITSIPAGVAADNIVTYDGSGNLTGRTAAQIVAAGGGAAVTANNGLTLASGNIQLGGALTKNTDIATAGFNASFSGTGNVGVGTTTPSARLHATGIGNAYPATTGATQSVGNIARFQTSDDLVLDLGGNSVNGSWIQSSNRTDLNVKYSLLLNPNGGNVGVGTTTPTANLHVAGNARITSIPAGAASDNIVTYDGSGNLTGRTAAQIVAAGGGAAVTANNGLTLASGNIQLGGALTKNTDIATAGFNASFSGTGNVGVGTTTPSARLHATGIGNAYPATTGATQSLGNIARFQTSDDLVLDLGGNSVNGSWIQSSLRTDLNVKYSLLLNPNGGNVGVGTTTPTANLHVAGNARITSIPAGVAADNIVTYDGSGNLTGRTAAQIVAAGGGAAAVTANNGLTLASGNIKLGGALTAATTVTLTPANTLSLVGGNVGIGVAANATNNLLVGGGTAGASTTPTTIAMDGSFSSVAGQNLKLVLHPAGFGVGVSNNSVDFASGSDFKWFGSAGAQNMTLAGASLGINTTAPTATLDVNGQGRIRTIPAGAAADNVVTYDGSGNLTGRTPAQIVAAGGGTAVTANNGLTLTSGNIQLGGALTKNTDIITAGFSTTFSGTGNVGIGSSTAPTAKLHVFGTSLIGNGTAAATALTGSGSLQVDGASTNYKSFDAAASTSVDFSKSNLAFTTATPAAFTFTGMKDGGTYTLVTKTSTVGTLAPSQAGLTFKSSTNAATTVNKHTVYTFMVIGADVYYYMTAGF